MRAPPPVSVVVRGTAWRGLHAALPAMGCGALAGWAAVHAGVSGPPAALAAGVAAIVAAGIAWRLAGRPPCRLAWDGQDWRIDDQSVQPALMLDLGRSMLLRCAAPGTAARWLAVSAAESGGAWHALRVAVLAAAADGTSAGRTADLPR